MARPGAATRIPIYLEHSRSWRFAASIEWPGWTRHARPAQEPTEELLAIAPRYGAAVALAGLDFEPPTSTAAFEVIETLPGDSGTEWGVPSIVPSVDEQAVDALEAERLLAILTAAWTVYDRAVAAAQGFKLRTGPRGGGRQLPRIIDHCLQADKIYLSKLGSARARIPDDEWEAAEADIRERALEAWRDRIQGRPVREPSRTRLLWPPRWYVRYVTWHNLVHAWEIEDRRTDEPV